MDKRYYEEKEYAQSMYALKHQQAQRNITTLTEDQHDVLANLCNTRHRLHVTAFNLIAKDENGLEEDSYKRTLQELNTALLSVGLNTIKGFKSLDDYYPPCCYDADIDGAYDDFIFSNATILNTVIEYNDTLMRNYLKEIDDVHHTQYCPTGKYRF